MTKKLSALSISAILYTLALVLAVPRALHMALALQPTHPPLPNYGQFETVGELGLVSLAVVALGLVVVWSEYFRATKAGWAMLFIITAGWAFPVRLLQFFIYNNSAGMTVSTVETLLRDPVLGHVFAESLIIVTLMIIALATSATYLLFGKRPSP